MRKPEEIRADIEKLTKELEAVKIHESRQVAAVNILYNLGWTHDPPQGLAETCAKMERLQGPTEGWRAGNVGGWFPWWNRVYPQRRQQILTGVPRPWRQSSGC